MKRCSISPPFPVTTFIPQPCHVSIRCFDGDYSSHDVHINQNPERGRLYDQLANQDVVTDFRASEGSRRDRGGREAAWRRPDVGRQWLIRSTSSGVLFPRLEAERRVRLVCVGGRARDTAFSAELPLLSRAYSAVKGFMKFIVRQFACQSRSRARSTTCQPAGEQRLSLLFLHARHAG